MPAGSWVAHDMKKTDTQRHKFPLAPWQILELQMNDFKYHYLFTSFDLETFEMEDFRYNFVNITAFRLVDTNDVFVKETLKEMEQFSRQQHIKFKNNLAVEVGEVFSLNYEFSMTETFLSPWLWLYNLSRYWWCWTLFPSPPPSLISDSSLADLWCCVRVRNWFTNSSALFRDSSLERQLQGGESAAQRLQFN